MNRRIFFVIFCILIWAGITDVALAGFGITPPYVSNNKLRPGSEYTQEIIIVRSDPVEDLNAELTMNLPDTESWFSVDRGFKFVLPKGESQVKINVTVRVPEDAKLGIYKGNIRIRTYSSQGPATGVSLALGAQIDVNLKVVDQIFEFAVRRVEMYEAEQGYKKWWLDFPGKIKFGMTIENTGNVPAAPSKVLLDIYDPSGQQLLEHTENSNTIEQLLPFASKRVNAYFPTWLPPGGYRVKYTIMKAEDDPNPAQQGELTLSVLPFGTITGYEKYGFEGLRLGDKLSIILPALFVTLLASYFVLRKKKRKNKGVRRSVAPREYEEEDEPYVRPASPRTRTSSGVVDLSRRR